MKYILLEQKIFTKLINLLSIYIYIINLYYNINDSLHINYIKL